MRAYKGKRWVVVVSLSALTFGGFVWLNATGAYGQRVRPSPPQLTLTRFFCEMAKENQCGSRVARCDGSVFSEGCQTEFSTKEPVSCDFIPPLSLPCP